MSVVPRDLETIVLPALTKHTATIIFIHGLGDDGFGMKPIADTLREDPGCAHIKWVLPHSPMRRVTASMGAMMPSWIDIYSYGFNTNEDEEGMLESAKTINKFISDEVASGTDPSRIILGGFSQGGTMSLLTGLSSEHKLAGIANLNGWLPMRSKTKELVSSHAGSTRIFWGYGDRDTLVTSEIIENSTKVLAEMGMKRLDGVKEVDGLSFNKYPGVGHTTCEQELKDLTVWIKKVVPDTEAGTSA